MSPALPTDFNLPEIEARTLERWRELGLFRRSQQARAGCPRWVFYEGPPTANGRPGVHHAWARVFKDLYPRFQTMRGKWVPRKAGWDCHGLPVELEVEKELGLSSKQDIEAYGIENFNARCRESVHRYVDEFAALTERAGIWLDTEDAYWTSSNEYIESVWWLFKTLWDRGLLYEGHRVTPYCGRCGTALSSHEVAQGYRDVVDPSVYVRFPISGSAGRLEGADLLVWTTTPWTLVTNVAVAVGNDLRYVRVEVEGASDLILSEQARERLFPDACVVGQFSGSELVGVLYERPFSMIDVDEAGAFRVVADGYVTSTEGTGIVHLAPAFGEDDYRIGLAESLPVLNPVDEAACFTEAVPSASGKFVRDANRELIDDLSARGLLVCEQPYEHSYPHCWRCDTPLIYWAKTTWFARTAEHRAELMSQNEGVRWHPGHLREGRFGKWLEGNVDWALSRDRYWGTPIPVWRCANGHDSCVGSIEELSRLAGRDDLGAVDLHRPFIDEVIIACPECGSESHRIEPVLDAWFDSGAMPTSQHHFPFGDRSLFEGSFPADFICEAIDQTRGWFYSLLAVNVLALGEAPYRNVVCLGLVVDDQGLKMSKSRGNVVDPWAIFDQLGADAMRWNFFSFGQPWTPRRISEESIRESSAQTLVKLWNVFCFAQTYAELDGWSPPAGSVAGGDEGSVHHVLDRWVLSQLDTTIATVGDLLEEYDALGAATRIAQFVDDLSNWYVRRGRQRYWMLRDATAHFTLYRCLEVLTRLLAPFCPMLSDEIYTRLTGEDSVHLADWPSIGGHDDALLDAQMSAARRLVALGRTARSRAGVKVRQPLPRALVLHPGIELSEEVEVEVADELNVKRIEDVGSVSELVSWTVVPNFRKLGPRLGSKVNDIKEALSCSDGSVLRRQLDAAGYIEVLGEQLLPDEVDVRASALERLTLVEEDGWAVALDLSLTEDLVREGRARELVRAINDLRKEQGFAIADRVHAFLSGDQPAEDLFVAYRDSIAREILAEKMVWVGMEDRGRSDPGTTVDLDGAVAKVWLLLA